MPPILATTIVIVWIAGLMLVDRRRGTATSWAVWIPILWVAIGGTRNVSEWLNGIESVESPDRYLEGSPLDRNVVSVLLAIGLAVLVARGRRTTELLRQNLPLVMFFVWALLSATWSDFGFVAFKRWTKGFGNAAMVVILLTDPNPREAIKRFFARTGFVLIPLSVLFIKYYPLIGRAYDRWEGITFNMGVATSKNGLGCLLLVLGVPCLWRVIESLRDRPIRIAPLLAHASMLGTALWLLYLANSATAKLCFALGAVTMFVGLRAKGRARQVHLFVTGLASFALATYVFRDAYTYVVESLGRNPTLTGRTELWDDLIVMITHPMFGTGYESFFLGDRAKMLWDKYWWHPNEAHNGYFEIFLTLGWIGVVLLATQIMFGYRNAIRAYRRDPALGSLLLAFLLAAIVYNFSEAAFKVMSPVWIAFLVAVTAVPPSLTSTAEETAVVPSISTRPLAASSIRVAPAWAGGRGVHAARMQSYENRIVARHFRSFSNGKPRGHADHQPFS